MKKYYFFSKSDPSMEAIHCGYFVSRKSAAIKFAFGKQLSLKSFLMLYSVSR